MTIFRKFNVVTIAKSIGLSLVDLNDLVGDADSQFKYGVDDLHDGVQLNTVVEGPLHTLHYKHYSKIHPKYTNTLLIVFCLSLAA